MARIVCTITMARRLRALSFARSRNPNGPGPARKLRLHTGAAGGRQVDDRVGPVADPGTEPAVREERHPDRRTPSSSATNAAIAAIAAQRGRGNDAHEAIARAGGTAGGPPTRSLRRSNGRSTRTQLATAVASESASVITSTETVRAGRNQSKAPHVWSWAIHR